MSTTESKRRQAPRHLSKKAADLWRRVDRDYDLEDHHRRLLTLACEALDRCDRARETIAEVGEFYDDRFGAPRAHPAVAVERDSRLAFARLMRELNLDDEAEPDARPPRR